MKKQQRLDAIIRDLKQQYFSGKELDISPQGGGFSTANNFKLTCDGKHYLLRLFPESMRETTFQKELAITELVGQEGIGPVQHYVNPILRFALIDYIDGKTLMLSDLQDSSSVKSIVELLVKLHTLETDESYKAASLIDEQQHFLGELNNSSEWLAHFDSQGDLELQNQLDRECDGAESLTHADLNLNNILKDSEQRLWFIDWTNAGYGSIYSDLSMLMSFMDFKDRELFLAEYIKASDFEFAPEKLAAYQLIRKFLGITWALAQAQRVAPEETIPISALKEPKEQVPLSQLIDDYLQERRSLKSKDDFLFLLSHYLKDYLKSKEQLLGQIHERRNPSP